MAEDDLAVVAGIINVHFVRWNDEAVSPDTLVVCGLESSSLKTHAHVNIINGHQGDGLGHLEDGPGSETRVQVAASATVRSVQVTFLDLLWDEIFTGVVPDRCAVQQQLADEQVFASILIALSLKEIHHVVRVGKNVIISV